MILGALTFTPDRSVPPTLERLISSTNSEGLLFKRVAEDGFSGGYYMHPSLPYKQSDIYFSDAAGDIAVLLSGSLYSRGEFSNASGSPATVPDPEFIASLFLIEGPEFVSRLNGDFAIFIYQPGKRLAYLFRDQAGIRPLAWTIEKGALLFSSDILGLCSALPGNRITDSDYLQGYFKYIDYRKTPNSLVKKLLPGHILRFSEKGTEIIRYWNPEKIRVDSTLSYDPMLADLKNLLGDAVKARCDQRFTAGTHLSSGLDSGIISCLVRREYLQQEKFYGFSWSPGDFDSRGMKYDERDHVRKTGQEAGITPVFSDLNEANFSGVISSLYYNHGYFFEDRTLEQAAGLGVNLLFSGWGGDEFISTGDRAIELDLLLGMKFLTYFRRNPVIPFKKYIKNQLNFVVFPALGILDRRTAKAFRDDARYLKKQYRKSDRKALRNFYFHRSRRQLHLRYLEFYHLQDRCESWTVNGFRRGIEYRYPLLDKRIIEYMLKVPSELLCKTHQYRPVMREMGKGILPEEVRLHWPKKDPVYSAHFAELRKNTAVLLMDEAASWADNPDLSFIDFEVLAEDISKFKANSNEKDGKVLFKALVYIKGMHEFTVKYHRI